MQDMACRSYLPPRPTAKHLTCFSNFCIALPSDLSFITFNALRRGWGDPSCNPQEACHYQLLPVFPCQSSATKRIDPSKISATIPQKKHPCYTLRLVQPHSKRHVPISASKHRSLLKKMRAPPILGGVLWTNRGQHHQTHGP